MKKLRCVVFDMEGTLFKKSYRLMGGNLYPSAWAVLCAQCGSDAIAEDTANRERYYRDEHIPGKYPYSQWVIDTIKIHQKYGLRRYKFEEIIDSVEYFDGVTETLATLKEWGVTIAVISGGLKALVDRVAIDHQIEHCFAAAEYFWNADYTIKHWNVQPTDFVHKRTLLEILCHDLGIKPNECAFVGDGVNDCDIARHCGMSIGFNPHSKLKDAVTTVIEQETGKEDLKSILEPLRLFQLSVPIKYSELNADAIKLDHVTKTLFRKYLVEHGNLTEKSSRSYITYLNSILINMQGAKKIETVTIKTALQLLVEAAKTAKSELSFIKVLSKPLAGPEGRIGDLTSTAKQFYRFVQLNKQGGFKYEVQLLK